MLELDQSKNIVCNQLKVFLDCKPLNNVPDAGRTSRHWGCCSLDPQAELVVLDESGVDDGDAAAILADGALQSHCT